MDRIVKALQLHRPLIVGWSYGTLVALDYLRYAGPDAVAGVELIGAFGGLTPPPTAPIPGAAEFARNRQRQLSPAIDQNYAAALFTTRSLTARPMSDDWTARTAAIAMMLPATARAAMTRRSMDNRDLLPRLARTPFLLNVGKHDIGLSEAEARDLRHALPESSVAVYEECCHSPFVEEPRRFTRELGEFAARVFSAR